jgi:hypothetical protein
LVKKNYSWAKGYTRRHQEAQQKEAKRAYYGRREGKKLMDNYSKAKRTDLLEGTQEAEIQRLEDQVSSYRAAWQAEKETAEAYRAGMQTAQKHLRQAEWRGFWAGALLGIPTGVLLLVVWTVFTKGWVFS